MAARSKPRYLADTMIYHMVPARDWYVEDARENYECESLITEGFIHCTDQPERLVWVANHFYQDIAGRFIILGIDEALVEPEIKWEEADGHIFPHVYGPLNRNAVVSVIEFPRTHDGTFVMPAEWRSHSD